MFQPTLIWIGVNLNWSPPDDALEIQKDKRATSPLMSSLIIKDWKLGDLVIYSYNVEIIWRHDRGVEMLAGVQSFSIHNVSSPARRPISHSPNWLNSTLNKHLKRTACICDNFEFWPYNGDGVEGQDGHQIQELFFPHGLCSYIQGVFLTGTPGPKKLKYVKPRLGESTLM